MDPQPVSLTLPLQGAAFHSTTLFAFFDGLIPEGWLLDIAEHLWKLNPRDRMVFCWLAAKTVSAQLVFIR